MQASYLFYAENLHSKYFRSLFYFFRLFETIKALDGKEDGLYFYRIIVKESRQYLKRGGWLIFEIGSDQAEAVKTLLQEAGYENIEVKKDLAGLDRVVYGMYS